MGKALFIINQQSLVFQWLHYVIFDAIKFVIELCKFTLRRESMILFTVFGLLEFQGIINDMRVQVDIENVVKSKELIFQSIHRNSLRDFSWIFNRTLFHYRTVLKHQLFPQPLLDSFGCRNG